MPPPSLLPPTKQQQHQQNPLMPPPPLPQPAQQQHTKPQPAQQQQQQQPQVELNYKEPDWSCAPDSNDEYSLEVIKNGTVCENIPINTKNFYLIGRLPICDIVTDHPSISRQHAVVQHKESGQVLLYDLSSTHGTFINKRRCPPNTYCPLRSGDVLKFGESTRLYVFSGGAVPETDDRLASNEPVSDKEPASVSSSFIQYFTAARSTEDSIKIQQMIRESRGSGWGTDDKFDAHDIDDHEDTNETGDSEKSQIQVEQDHHDDDQDEFYNRTEQFKEAKWLKDLMQDSYQELMNKKEMYIADREELQLRFKKSAEGDSKANDDDQDSLEQFMKQNDQQLKKNIQQEIMSQMMGVSKRISIIEQQLQQRPEYKKHQQQQKLMERQKQLEQREERLLQQHQQQQQQEQDQSQHTKSQNEGRTLEVHPKPAAAMASKNIFRPDVNDEDNKKPKSIIPLSDDIPEEYQIKTKKRPQTQPEDPLEKAKKLRETLQSKQESEFVDLIERESQMSNGSANKYGY
ncbi:hypothetical protein SAMD00019534_007890 [Acytostelium subglobosum LB1]|uniref:hypothetical protein n=1 Tax=Acytostelium subglobosum LB1 TaxID=1410327 RepID=UPI00064500CA|nr:hypothetical protein SAMD00019534_007890 [Acytostelium subglobosum LB1]GAM17614.1 hypothetical protein SAMD00019534_007890 [Acytostelium subglobosum LB1]|eukprot:XP_012758210.1 hypothetical protein SAMD00019534_007890 [Acytostelium subglobosum LB1]